MIHNFVFIQVCTCNVYTGTNFYIDSQKYQTTRVIQKYYKKHRASHKLCIIENDHQVKNLHNNNFNRIKSFIKFHCKIERI